MRVPEAMREAGYSRAYVRREAGPFAKRLIEKGLIPDPDLQTALVSAHDQAIEDFMARLRAELPEAADRLILAMRGKLQDYAGVEAFLDRVIGKPAVHIHGHKDAAELEAERELTIRVIREDA